MKLKYGRKFSWYSSRYFLRIYVEGFKQIIKFFRPSFLVENQANVFLVF